MDPTWRLGKRLHHRLDLITTRGLQSCRCSTAHGAVMPVVTSCDGGKKGLNQKLERGNIMTIRSKKVDDAPGTSYIM